MVALTATAALVAFAAGAAARVVPRAAVIYEAEDATLSGTAVDTAQSGYSGTGYVSGFDTSTDKITFTVTSDSLQLYDLSIRYAGIYGEKRMTMILNSGAGTEVYLAASTSWETASAGQVLLNAGTNTIEIVNNWGWYLIDYISLEESAPRGPHNINTGLVNRGANTDAKALYSYLRSIYGNKILSGQQDLSWADWIATQTGKTPALVSVDLMDYSPSRVEHGTVGTSVEDAITHSNRGGIVSVLWHWNAPTGLYDTSDNPWWSGFYTRATDFDVAAALSSTTNANYTLILRDIDAIAVQLKRLESAGVPVLWRPLHEAEGGWFWWGAKGAEPCKKLYALLYDRLTNHHNIKNLVWVWNSVTSEWYPGSSTVDILSTDVYVQGNGPMSAQYNQLIELANDTKLIAATEVGSAPFPDLLVAYEAHWLWFCVWSNDFINNDAWNSVVTLNTIYKHDYVLTLDEIKGWRKRRLC